MGRLLELLLDPLIIFSNLWFLIWPGGIFLVNSWEGRRGDHNWRPTLPTIIVFFVLFVIATIQLMFLINAISGFGPIDPQHDMIAIVAFGLTVPFGVYDHYMATLETADAKLT